MADTEYAILVYPRKTEDDPTIGVVIYCNNGTYWHPMVTGQMDWCNDILDALYYREYKRQEEKTNGNK